MKCKRRIRRWKEWTKERSRLAHEAKARKRMANPVKQEPRMVKACRYRVVIVDTYTGDRGEFELRSLRDVGRRLAVMLRYYD
jgi:hypothetical protein